jgi:hypothetical protein
MRATSMTDAGGVPVTTELAAVVEGSNFERI